jgi:cell division protein FtsN
MELNPTMEVCCGMKSTSRKARSGMVTFVVTIFTAAVIIAGVYFLFLTPGEPENEAPQSSLDQAN